MAFLNCKKERVGTVPFLLLLLSLFKFKFKSKHALCDDADVTGFKGFAPIQNHLACNH